MMRFTGTPKTVPTLVSFLALHAVIGAMVGCFVAGACLLTDVAGIGTLLVNSDVPILASGMLVFGFVITFASVVAGSAVLRLSDDDQ